MVKRSFAALTTVVIASTPAFAQRGLEGTTVTVKMDMPASQTGVDVYPDDRSPIDFHKVADRLKQYGVGVHNGESIMITKVVPKKDHIEVQLGGGGYGTFGDVFAAAANSAPTVPYEFKSQHEKDLEAESKYGSNYWDRRSAREDLDHEKRERNRDNAQAAMINAQSRAINQANEARARSQDGSRFNIRYRGSLPGDAASADSIREALAQVVDFGDGGSYGRGYDAPQRSMRPSGGSGAGGALHKGLTISQVEQTLGPASKVDSRAEGGLETMVRQYNTDDGQRVTAQFVGGVLVDYQIAPR